MLDNGYGIMPNSILFSDLSDKQKLLFCLISSLCAEKGYCWATNEFMGKKLKAQPKTISYNIGALSKAGYIQIEIDQSKGNERKIWMSDPIPKKRYTYTEKTVEGYTEKTVDNNISIILQTNSSSEQQFFDLFLEIDNGFRKGYVSDTDKENFLALSEGILDKKELFKFCNYWVEKNKKGKMRWELQKTFELRRRMLNWKSRLPPGTISKTGFVNSNEI